MAAWPHLTAEEQVELLDAAEIGTKRKNKKNNNSNGDDANKSPVPAAAAAAALVAAAVLRGSPSLVARAARLLDAEAAAMSSAGASPPSSAARAARVAAALMLGDVASAEAAVGVSAARQLQNASSASVPDPRLVAYVSSFDPRDPLPGLCALAEAWVSEAALSGCRPPSPSQGSPLLSSPEHFSLARWASSPAVALRLAAGEQAGAARAAAGAARRAASGVGGALSAAAAGASSFVSSLPALLLRPRGTGSKGGFPEEEGEEGERDDEVNAAYRARFYGDEGEGEVEEEAGRDAESETEEEGEGVGAVAPPPRRRASSRPSSSPSSSLPPLPIEAAKARTVGELAAAYARATEPSAWRSSPLPPDAVRPLEGEDDLWLGTAAARGRSSSPLSPLLRGASLPSSLARAAVGGLLLLGAALAVSRVAGRGAASAPGATAAASAAVGSGVSASPPPLSAKEAKSLLSSFQAAKARACGSSPEAAAAPLEEVLSGKLLAEWKGRQRDLDGWTLSYKTKTLKVVEVVAPSSSSPSGKSGLLSRFSFSESNRAVFLARVEEKVTLRDEEGLVVDESDAGYDARFVAVRKNGNGEWKLSECFVS